MVSEAAARAVDKDTELFAKREQVRHELEKAKLRPVSRPLYRDGQAINPKVPSDITLLSDEDVGDLHARFCAITGYVGYALAGADIDHLFRAKVTRYIKSKLTLSLAGGLKQYEILATIEVNPQYKEALDNEVLAEATKKLMQSLYDNYLQGKEACSREITRRIELRAKRGSG